MKAIIFVVIAATVGGYAINSAKDSFSSAVNNRAAQIELATK